MNLSKEILVFAVAGLFFVSCKNQNNSETEGKENETDSTAQREILTENLQEASFIIEGMHCEYGCAKGIEKKLAKLDGIKSVEVNFDSKEAKIQYNATLQTPQVIAQTVESMSDSYKVSDIKSSSDQSFLYLDKGKPKKRENPKKEDTKTEKTSASTDDKKVEKKSCCTSKKSCQSKDKTL